MDEKTTMTPNHSSGSRQESQRHLCSGGRIHVRIDLVSRKGKKLLTLVGPYMVLMVEDGLLPDEAESFDIHQPIPSV